MTDLNTALAFLEANAQEITRVFTQKARKACEEKIKRWNGREVTLPPKKHPIRIRAEMIGEISLKHGTKISSSILSHKGPPELEIKSLSSNPRGGVLIDYTWVAQAQVLDSVQGHVPQHDDHELRKNFLRSMWLGTDQIMLDFFAFNEWCKMSHSFEHKVCERVGGTLGFVVRTTPAKDPHALMEACRKKRRKVTAWVLATTYPLAPDVRKVLGKNRFYTLPLAASPRFKAFCLERLKKEEEETLGEGVEETSGGEDSKEAKVRTMVEDNRESLEARFKDFGRACALTASTIMKEDYDVLTKLAR